MSVRAGKDYLYLIWKSEKSRRQYIVGQLTKNGGYKFQYSNEVHDAIKDGFSPLLSFDDLEKTYSDEKLFSVFASRLPDRKRRDINKILEKYRLKEYDEYMLLKRSGARLPMDNLEFIDPILDTDEANISRTFYIAGVRHYLNCKGEECSNAENVTRGDEIFLSREETNIYDKYAVKMLNASGLLLGYVPRYYSKSISEILEKGKHVSCHVYNVEKNRNCSECIKVIMQI